MRISTIKVEKDKKDFFPSMKNPLSPARLKKKLSRLYFSWGHRGYFKAAH
jgi:hypothetical protein